jgi:hypothetical protein
MYCTKTTNDITFLCMSCERQALKFFSPRILPPKHAGPSFACSWRYLQKLATSGPERALCVLAFDESKCATDIKRKFRTAYGKEAPRRKAIYDWHNKFVTAGCLCPRKRSGRPGVREENVQRVRETFGRSPKKSLRRASVSSKCQ